MLNEGIFRDMFTSAKDKMKMLANKVKQALKKFWEKFKDRRRTYSTRNLFRCARIRGNAKQRDRMR